MFSAAGNVFLIAAGYAIGALCELPWRALAWVLSRRPVVNWLIARASRSPYTPIVKEGTLYMARFWLFNRYDTPRLKWPLPSVRLHMIARPDDDRHLHDHPWNARTIILRGGYVEERDGSIRALVAGQTAVIQHGQFHRIRSILGGRDAVTLFITGRYRGTWGFRVNGQKVPHREYLRKHQ